MHYVKHVPIKGIHMYLLKKVISVQEEIIDDFEASAVLQAIVVNLLLLYIFKNNDDHF